MKKLILGASLALVAAGAGGCGCGGSAPIVDAFGALPGIIAPGGTAVLTWVVADAETITIDNGVGIMTGTVVAVSPDVTTTYTLTAVNKRGTTTAPATVTVDVSKPHQGMAGFKVTPATNSPVAGAATSFTVTAVDGTGATVTRYAGTVHFMVTDPSTQAVTPADYAFVPGDQGTHAVSATLVTAGSSQLIAQDARHGGLAGQATVTVVPAAASSCTLAGLPGNARAGDAVAFRLTVLDAFNNVANNGYAGTVAFSSSDGRATTPAAFTFTPGDRGTREFSATFGSLGPQSVTATDGASSITCSGTPVAISAGRATSIQLGGVPSSATAGATNAFQVTAYDAYGNVATDFADTLSLTSTDPSGTFPLNGAFSNGVASASVRFVTAGTRQVVAIDPSNPTITAQALVDVGPASASACTAAGAPAAARAGDAIPLRVTFLDAFGNVAAGYAGTVSFTSIDGRASLPPPFTFTNPDQGAHGFNVGFGTPGSQSVTVTDPGASITCASGAVAVSNGPAVAFQLSGVPPSATAGAANAFTVTAFDAFGNVALDYAGTLSLSSTDPGGTFPVNGAFANGVASASVRFVTAGTRQLTAADPVNPALSAQALVSVDPASASTCTASGIPASARAGDVLPLEVTLSDAFGNAAVGYAGTVTFTSADPRASLPSNYTFTPADQGAHGFSVRFGTPGPVSVAAADTVALISCFSGSSSLSAGPASTFAVQNLPAAAVAGEEAAFQATAMDGYGNVATDYAGPVTLSSTDAAATFPTSGSFSLGVASFGVAFQTIGAQTVTVADTPAGFSGRSGAVGVHGLRYTGVGPGAETLRLVIDPSSSPARVVLHLVAQKSAAGYSAGFNIPADASRASLVSIVQGGALNPGTSPAAMAASLPALGPMANVFTAGISQKATDTTADAAIGPGQVLYTVTLKPASTQAGVIFDGSQPFRAAVRDFEGNEVLSQSDFAVGRLELQ